MLTDLSASGHLGLTLLQERAQALGGTITFGQVPGSGAQVTLRAPLTLLHITNVT